MKDGRANMPRIIVFDVNETLLDVSALEPHFVRVFGDSALFRDGELMPHLELSQHPVHGGNTYDEYLGDRARKRVGTRKWNRRVRRVLAILETVVSFDELYLGGGNAARINELGGRVRVVENKAGLLGGIALWR